MLGKKKTILISEDNFTNMKLLKDILEFEGYNIIEAYDGKEALENVIKYKDVIDLILMDIQLPEIDGLEVVKRLKANDETKNLPVFAISAHAMDVDIKKALDVGCEEYITKPISISSFLERVKSFLMNT